MELLTQFIIAKGLFLILAGYALHQFVLEEAIRETKENMLQIAKNHYGEIADIEGKNHKHQIGKLYDLIDAKDEEIKELRAQLKNI